MLKKSPKTPAVIMECVSDLYLAAEAPKGVDLQVRDSGRGSPLTDEELKASIYRAGIIQPLIWKLVDGKKYVIAGNRRLRFAREIFVDAPTSLVPTQNVDDFDGDWREIAIDTNLSLPPHLVERYENIVKLAQDLKLTEKETCARYGMSDAQYRRVMALGKMAPVVRQAWKDGEIDAKTAQTFTLEPDPKEQEKIFAALTKGDRRISEWDVQRRVIPQSQQEIGKLVTFIGVPALKKAGLLKQEDLFATERSAHHIVTDVKSLNKLVDDQLIKLCQELVSAGWKWAVPESKIEGRSYEYGDVHPKKVSPTKQEAARLKQIENLLDNDDIDSDVEDDLLEERERIEVAVNSRGYSDEQKAKAGCFVRIGHSGAIEITYGKVKPSEKRQVQASERPKKPAKKVGEVSLTNALAQRLSTSLQKAISEALERSPNVAVSALIAGFASSGHIIDVDIGTRQRNYYGRDGNEKHFLTVFEGAMKATPESRAVMLTKVAAEALSIVVLSGDAKPPMADKALEEMVGALPADTVNAAMKRNFDAANYFEGLDLKSIVAAVRCSIGNEHADRVAKMKKKEAVKFAASECPKANYLPPMLRTPHYTGPTESMLTKAAKKDKKPAPAKKSAKKKPRK